MTLQDIADDLFQRIENSTNDSKTEMLTVIAELVEVLIQKAGPAGSDPKDAQIVELQNRVKSLQSLLDNDAMTFQAIKLALGNPNLTQGALANEIKSNWRHK